MFGIPGAFTPVCSGSHVPGFIAKSGDFKSKVRSFVACRRPRPPHPPLVPGLHTPVFLVVSSLPPCLQRVDEIVCLTPNDHFVAKAFAKDQIAGDSIAVLADGNLTLTKALKMEVDMSKAGMGLRSNRFAMVIDNGVVTGLNVEKGPGNYETSDASSTLALLK